MKSKLQGLVKKLAPVKATLLKIKDKLPKKKPHSEKYYKRIITIIPRLFKYWWYSRYYYLLYD